MTDHLVGGQRSSELFSYLDVFQRLVEQGLHDADGFSPECGHRAVDRGFDRGQRVAAIAEQGVGGEMHIPEVEVTGPATAKPLEVAQGEAARALRHQEQAEPARLAVAVIDTGRDDELPGGIAVERRWPVSV